MKPARLRLSDVACLRGDRVLFRGISLDLSPGAAAVVTGSNGIGKSSLLRLCAGLLRPYAGTVDRQGGVTLCDERPALDGDVPLDRALGFWARLDGAAPGTLERAMHAMALDRLAKVPVRMLSTGQRKRATLARVVASGAAVWLLDEPANGLDAMSLELLGVAMAGHLAAGGIVLAASHQPLPLAAAIALSLERHRVEVEA